MDNNNRGNNKKIIFAFIVGILMLVFTSGIIYLVYTDILKRAGIDQAENAISYDKHFVMIADTSDSDFWDDVYASMQEAGNEESIYVEFKSWSRENKYTMCDMVEMCIAGKVDGIIIQNNGEEGLSEILDEAVDSGIPVVTILNDAPKTKRISYIGINPYSVGQMYADKLIEMIPDSSDSVTVDVFLDDNDIDRNQYQIFTQINTALVNNSKTSGRISVNAITITADELFESDEIIRNQFKYASKAPDYAICFSTAGTDAIYQAVIDYNLAGSTHIIGYYLSETSRQAIDAGNISMTMVINSEEMGRCCIEALDDYMDTGYTNSYYGIDLEFVTKGDLSDEE